MSQQLRCHEDIGQPYALVRDLLLENPGDVFRRATAAAIADAATLRVGIGALEVNVGIELQIREITSDDHDDSPVTKLTLGWSAAHAPALFPVMATSLLLYPIAPDTTRLELDGIYQPPLGKAGTVIDAILGHRIAEASVMHFVRDVAAWLREELARRAPKPDVAPESVPAELEC